MMIKLYALFGVAVGLVLLLLMVLLVLPIKVVAIALDYLASTLTEIIEDACDLVMNTGDKLSVKPPEEKED